ncbi:hypothetical protein BLX24_15165 [Arsenicibacter rosenii]|uniref:TonB-dependent receptor plug domain-containing protein n=1 Tax=Arsenicibacter rosenii TaxID=1750698 RepID=A0A1S2VI93_9BACT|nr:hypothetical protein BLX24_15165 [Arsenicibacter rosenii]
MEPRRQPDTRLPVTPGLSRKLMISGYVKEQNSGENLVGATVFVAGKAGTITNNYGYYALSLPENEEVELIVSLVGYQRVYQRIRLIENTLLNVELANNDSLDEVVLRADATENAWSVAQTSQHTIPLRAAETIPAVAGEKDVLKTLQFLPGVHKDFNGQVGLHIRGGGSDQNLLILDDAPVYNANHLFGFFSVFNVDALKSIRLQKGGFPARYGGRLSSVVEMSMREGNNKHLKGEVGTGLITSRLILEGPVIREKASFLLTARRTNFSSLLGNFVAKVAESYSGTNWKSDFHDLNAKLNVDLNRRNRLYLSGYFGRDFFGGGDSLDASRRWENVLRWGNTTSTLRWNHLFSERLFANLSFIFSQYDFTTHTKYVPIDASIPNSSVTMWRYFNRLTDYTLKYDLEYFPKQSHQIQTGITSTQRFFRLNGFDVSDTVASYSHIEPIRSIESSVYAEDNWNVSKNLKLAPGGRATLYQVNEKTFFRIEPRLAVLLKLTGRTALLGSYSEMNQFVHQLTNTGQGLPTDLWVPALPEVKPQRSRQIVLGCIHELTSKWQLSIEMYRKWMSHIIGYHPDAGFIGLTNAQRAEHIRWERNIVTGTAEASGLECMVQRKTGRFSGWFTYTWAITLWRFPALNNGQPFFPAHDRRHTFSWIGIYELNSGLKLSASCKYGSGSPQTTSVLGVSGFGSLTKNNPPAPTPPGGLSSPHDSFSGFRGVAMHQLDVRLQKTFAGPHFTHQLELTITDAYVRSSPYAYTSAANTSRNFGQRLMARFPFLPSVSYTLQF